MLGKTFRALGLELPTPDTVSVISGDALASALKTMEDEDKAYDLAELTLVGLEDTPADTIWRQMVAMDTSFHRSSFSRQLRAEGNVEGRSAAVLRVLDKRGVAITDQQRARLAECTDLDQLDTWLDRAVTAACASEVFDAD